MFQINISVKPLSPSEMNMNVINENDKILDNMDFLDRYENLSNSNNFKDSQAS